MRQLGGELIIREGLKAKLVAECCECLSLCVCMTARYIRSKHVQLTLCSQWLHKSFSGGWSTGGSRCP